MFNIKAVEKNKEIIKFATILINYNILHMRCIHDIDNTEDKYNGDKKVYIVDIENKKEIYAIIENSNPIMDILKDNNKMRSLIGHLPDQLINNTFDPKKLLKHVRMSYLIASLSETQRVYQEKCVLEKCAKWRSITDFDFGEIFHKTLLYLDSHHSRNILLGRAIYVKLLPKSPLKVLHGAVLIGRINRENIPNGSQKVECSFAMRYNYVAFTIPDSSAIKLKDQCVTRICKLAVLALNPEVQKAVRRRYRWIARVAYLRNILPKDILFHIRKIIEGPSY